MSAAEWLKGGAAGFVATVPMTIFMEATYRGLPRRERYPLPPREITDEALNKLGVEEDLPERVKFQLSVANHFAFGTVSGLILSRLFSKLDLPVPAKGPLLGSALWAVNYLGWIPAARILKPAARHPWRRNALMLGAHLVWGTTVAWILSRMPATQRETLQEPYLEMA